MEEDKSYVQLCPFCHRVIDFMMKRGSGYSFRKNHQDSYDESCTNRHDVRAGVHDYKGSSFTYVDHHLAEWLKCQV